MKYNCVYLDEITGGYDEHHMFNERRAAGWYVWFDYVRSGITHTKLYQMNEMVCFDLWCKENLHHRWEVNYRYVYMSNAEDAMIFKLVWST
jgi:predicted amidohydrolase